MRNPNNGRRLKAYVEGGVVNSAELSVVTGVAVELQGGGQISRGCWLISWDRVSYIIMINISIRQFYRYAVCIAKNSR